MGEGVTGRGAGDGERIAGAKGKGQGKRAARDLRALLVSLGLQGYCPYGRLATESARDTANRP